eukprot:TRINITY_DN35895_c0_g1_i1.p1 TRINITY_DN35895_c0_g1~~TRINITY_DN35895_c0_g1_i1.p1  ORF type:complete len:273 (+),score=74.62 TRINITY_DN35895_c0_g1_i1:80-820(+)
MPTQVLVSLTPHLQTFFESECLAEGSKEQAKEEAVDLDELYRLVGEHEKKGGTPPKLHELLEGSEVIERRRAEERELTEIERIRLQAQERAYQRSVHGLAVDPVLSAKKRKEPGEGAGAALKFATNFGTQVMVAFIGAFALGYFFVETFVTQDFNAKVISGAACSFATLLLETLLLVVHESKERMIDETRGKMEREENKRQKQAAAAARRAKEAGPAAADAVEDAKTGTSEDGAGEPKPATEKKDD